MIPKVSVIVPCYNYEDYIEQCIMSVLLQKVDFNIEIIVGDDNSTDNSFAIVNRMKKFYENENIRFNLIKHENNIGEINNTKSLLESSIGQYIAYLDADDFWTDPYKLKKQIDFMDNNLDYSMCMTGHILLKDNCYIPISDLSSWLCPVDINNLNSENLVNGNIVGSSSSRLFRNYGDLTQDYFYDFPYSDWVINFELSFKGKIKYLDFPSYIYRIHNNSLSKKDSIGEIEELNNLYNKRVSILKEIRNQKLCNQSKL